MYLEMAELFFSPKNENWRTAPPILTPLHSLKQIPWTMSNLSIQILTPHPARGHVILSCFPNTQINRNCLKTMVEGFLSWTFPLLFPFYPSPLPPLLSLSPSCSLLLSCSDTHLKNFSSSSHYCVYLLKELCIHFLSFNQWSQSQLS